jgi:hypothetical protein
MRKSTLLMVVATALVVSVASTGSLAAAPVYGATIANAASATSSIQEVRWGYRWHGYRRYGYRQCNNSPAEC